MELHILVKIFVSAALMGVLRLILHVYRTMVVEPKRLRSKMGKQGISGPPPTFLFGNIGEITAARSAKSVGPTTNSLVVVHDCATTLFPFFKKWTNLYGQIFIFSLGNIQILHVNQPDIVKEITTCTSLDLGKPSYQHKERGALLGQGILTSNSTVWAHQRKILAPELYMEKVKGMMSLVTESAVTMVNSWKSRIESEGGMAEIKIDQDMRSFSGDVISRACFGSNYSKGEEIFKRLRALQEALSKKLTMVIHESLRLYPPVTVISREALKDMKFGDIHIPKGLNLWILMVTLHTDPKNWGPDAQEFNPERFANGIAGACKLPHLYMPFGVGPRVCLGQNLAMAELKILIALVLSNFSLKLSPNYVHSPALRLVIEPEHGVHLLVNKL